MKKVVFLALALLLITGSAFGQDKGRVTLPGTSGSDVKGPVQSANLISVPNVVGKSLAEAITILDSAGFVIKNTGTGNIIKAQSPAGNTKAAPGSTVNLTR
jgi:beta-lactam-binding protein with PASTA domain